MTIDETIAASTKSVSDQMELNQTSLQNKLAIGEQIILQNAANVVTRLAQEQALTPNPT